MQKELKHLRRGELIEIIYKMKQNEQKLLDENQELKRRLEERELKIQNVGSLAEASLVLTDLFKTAEESVAIYVAEINRRYQELQASSEQAEASPEEE